MSITFTPIGTTNEIGDASFLLNLDGNTVILDAGMHPRKQGVEGIPNFQSVKDQDVDAIFLSHCHLDHLGALPPALSYFPQASVLMSEASAILAPVMLQHTAGMMRRQHLDESGPVPLYSRDDIDLISYIFQGVRPEHDFPVFNLQKWANDLTVQFYDAGHILGASGILLKSKSGTVFYTGDTCAQDQEIMPGAVFPDKPVDLLILESTLGADPSAEEKTRQSEEKRFAKAIYDVIDNQGSVLIPAFSLGRTQEMLAQLHRLREQSQIPDVEIYSAGFGEVISRYYDQTLRYTRRKNPDLRLEDLDIRPLPPGDVRRGPHLRKPSIILVSSGMMAQHTMSYRLAEVMLPDPRHGIFFVGYIAPDMPGFQVRTAQKGQMLKLGPDSPEQQVQCHIDRFHFSAHSHRQHLLGIVEKLRPKRVVLVHGELGAAGWLRETIKNNFPKTDVTIAQQGTSIEY
ncbi:MAG: MBL fold metallo-hydrolase [Candidatus Latescibacteria bacterium]|nr:MBL fold metallo-hydrolase [Candidatus Latescibacterota bacterium]